ncbi:MAG: hypothetical protein V4682_04180 [Patescibacteria group bacterium]
MAPFETGPLRNKLPELHTEPQIEKAVQNAAAKGERIPNTPEARIGTYLDRLDTILTYPDQKKRERNLMLLKPFLYDELVIKEEQFPESYFELQKRVYRERGQAVEEFTPDQRKQMIDIVRQDQAKSLDEWAEYFTSDDAVYPTWFKYLAFRSITKLSQFDKERQAFKKRSKDTVAPYPEIHREALATVADKLEWLAKGDTEKFDTDEHYELYAESKFSDLYANAIGEAQEGRLERADITRGEWIVYEKGNMDEASKLYESLEGKGTGWCTAGKSTAETQVRQGDFHVYYTFKDDVAVVPTEPRIAVRMQEDQIAEVRGVLSQQGVEPILQEIVDEKLASFGDRADSFKKKSEDMRRMTAIEAKASQGEPLAVDDLRFLYEIDESIEGFGYGKDPRVNELRHKRMVEGRENEDQKAVLGDILGEALPEDSSEIKGVAFSAIAQGNGEKILNAYMRAPGFWSEVLSKEELAQQLLRSGKGGLLTQGPFMSTYTYQYSTERLSAETAHLFVEHGESSFLLEHRHAFTQVSDETLTLLAQKAPPFELLRSLGNRGEQLNPEDERILIDRMTPGDMTGLGYYISVLHEENHPNAADAILRTGMMRAFRGTLHRFKNVDHNAIIREIARAGELTDFIRESDWRSVDDIDFDFIANEILSARENGIRNISNEFNFFKTLSPDVLRKLLADSAFKANRLTARLNARNEDDSYGSFVREHRVEYGPMAETILKNPDILESLIPTFNANSNLTEATAEALIRIGRGDVVAEHTNYFEPLSEEITQQLQPYMDGYSYRNQMAA